MLEKGTVVDGKYVILKEIGTGGMSTVYLAEHQLLGQKWAIKEIQKETRDKKELIRQSLLAETNILKRLEHPNLPRIIDVIQTKETMLLVMDYIEGITLQELIENLGPQEEKQVIQWAKTICEVLIYLHTRKPPIIYRDLKPSNLMLRSDGTLVLIDFGTAVEYYRKEMTDVICLGTDGYAAPEQYTENGGADERADIYSFGMTIYTLLTGRILDPSIYEACFAKREDTIISPEMEQLIMTCTREEPLARYQDCFALKAALCNLEQKQIEQESKRQKKVFLLRLLLTGAMICGCITLGIFRFVDKSRYKKAIAYVNQAEKNISDEKILEDYKIALQLMPGERQIYESIAEHFVRPNDFHMEEAASLLSLLEVDSSGRNVMSIFCKKDPEGYCSFCYTIGIGYFYHMGEMTGKKEARVWFQDVIRTESPEFDKGKKRRAVLYEKICKYYSTFIENGEDNSGEETKEGYEDFYDTLHELNQIKFEQNSNESDAAAMYLISREIAIEIGNYASEFLNENGISAHELLKELLIIDNQTGRQGDRISILNRFFEKKEMDELRQFVREAKRKVILAEQRKNQGEE